MLVSSRQISYLYVLEFAYLALPLLLRNMSQQDLDQMHQKSQARVRSIYAFTMGLILFGVGLFLIFHRKLGFEFDFDPLYSGLFGVICILYGVFRIWRGYKSN